MAWGRAKTEHSGPKRGKGFWGRKAEAKQASKVARRGEGRRIAGASHQDVASESERESS